jgi:hypothetical protein
MASYDLLKLIAFAGEHRLLDVAVRLAAKNEALFLELASESGMDVPPTTYELSNGQSFVVYQHQFAKVREAYNSDGGGRKVQAIKCARDVCEDRFGDHLGLKDAKDLVEHLMKIGRLEKAAYDQTAYNYKAVDTTDPLRSRW